MQDGQSKGSIQSFADAANGVAILASDVIERLVKGEYNMTAPLREDLIERFMNAVVNSDLTDFETIKPDLRRARVSPAMFADRYLPEIARRMGKAWEDDTLSFAEVTLGASRLQAILRQIGNDWSADEGAGASESAAVLLIVPVGQQHTLGALILLGQLRRQGVSVCLRVGPTEAELRVLLAMRRFDGAMISLALPDELAATRATISALKAMTAGQLRIALGGAALLNSSAKLDAPEADIVTNDLILAIAALGLQPAVVAQKNTG